MKQDELLNELGRLARTQAERATPAEPGADELLRPLDAAVHARIVARLLPLVGAEMSPAHATGAHATGAATLRSAQTIPRRRWPRRWLMVVAPALAAAMLLLWFVRPQARGPLPAYVLELRGGQLAERSAAANADIRVGGGDLVSAVLRPAKAVSGAVAARVFINGRALPDTAGQVVEKSADGAVRMSGLGPALAALPPGRHRLQFAVGRPGSLPEALPDPLSPSPLVANGVQLLSYEVERLPH